MMRHSWGETKHLYLKMWLKQLIKSGEWTLLYTHTHTPYAKDSGVKNGALHYVGISTYQNGKRRNFSAVFKTHYMCTVFSQHKMTLHFNFQYSTHIHTGIVFVSLSICMFKIPEFNNHQNWNIVFYCSRNLQAHCWVVKQSLPTLSLVEEEFSSLPSSCRELSSVTSIWIDTQHFLNRLTVGSDEVSFHS